MMNICSQSRTNFRNALSLSPTEYNTIKPVLKLAGEFLTSHCVTKTSIAHGGAIVAKYSEDFCCMPPDSLSSEMDGNRKVLLLPIFFLGLRSGSLFRQLLMAIKNILGLPMGELQSADELVRKIVTDCRNKFGTDVEVKPLLIGHSLGSVPASVLAVRHGWLSICFNPLGLGRGARHYAGNENLQKVNNLQSLRHLSFTSPGDWVSSPTGWWLLRRIQSPGLRILTPDYAPQYDIEATRKHARIIHILFPNYLYLLLSDYQKAFESPSSPSPNLP
ncbi:MAG: hypothetical protein LBP65_02980 [Puniceicoccales bacterium]|jgi:hypothetical protein|nr:hypothetical protein [Puniceicoccales bacterium]